MISHDLTYAIVGASQDSSKYGNIVLRDLQSAGFKVIPVNPNADEVAGLKSYPKLADIPEKPDVAVFVVPPNVTNQVIKEAHEAGINRVWMQPGSQSDEAIKYCEQNGMECVHHACIMVERRWRKD